MVMRKGRWKEKMNAFWLPGFKWALFLKSNVDIAWMSPLAFPRMTPMSKKGTKWNLCNSKWNSVKATWVLTKRSEARRFFFKLEDWPRIRQLMDANFLKTKRSNQHGHVDQKTRDWKRKKKVNEVKFLSLEKNTSGPVLLGLGKQIGRTWLTLQSSFPSFGFWCCL